MKPRADAAVIGIGNDFRRDDGVGWAAVSLLRHRAAQRLVPSASTVLAQCDGDPGRLIALWENVSLAIVVDACFPPAARPGRLHRWGDVAGGLLPSVAPGSTHGFGLAEALQLAEVLGRGPGRLVVYAVEGADRSLGMGLTPALVDVLPRLARRIEDDIERHCKAAVRCPRAS